MLERVEQPDNIQVSFDQTEETWNFDTLTVWTKDGVVNSVDEYGDEQPLNVQSIIDEFGCPNVIFTLAPGEENSNGRTLFFYYQIGLELLFDGMQVSLQQKPEAIVYSIPSKSIDEWGYPPSFLRRTCKME